MKQVKCWNDAEKIKINTTTTKMKQLNTKTFSTNAVYATTTTRTENATHKC